MARSTCTPCCDPNGMARSQLTYRASVLKVLCEGLTVSGLGATAENQVLEIALLTSILAALNPQTPFKRISTAGTNAAVVKASPGILGYLTASNINAAFAYVKLYNKATAPTVGTDVPIHTFLVPGDVTGAGTNIPIPDGGINFSAGISIAITTGVGDADTGAVAANEVVVNIGYK